MIDSMLFWKRDLRLMKEIVHQSGNMCPNVLFLHVKGNLGEMYLQLTLPK